ncbi:hypothetical protein IQ06DRAFT_129656 [Phaeosphaeriaceae sp. SRC1lsM3a]|nr:hypothetical protein IQ06DRAFT_129656 [Stagonospora sp. SRC1lsM3a]
MRNVRDAHCSLPLQTVLAASATAVDVSTMSALIKQASCCSVGISERAKFFGVAVRRKYGQHHIDTAITESVDVHRLESEAYEAYQTLSENGIPSYL